MEAAAPTGSPPKRFTPIHQLATLRAYANTITI